MAPAGHANDDSGASLHRKASRVDHMEAAVTVTTAEASPGDWEQRTERAITVVSAVAIDA